MSEANGERAEGSSTHFVSGPSTFAAVRASGLGFRTPRLDRSRPRVLLGLVLRNGARSVPWHATRHCGKSSNPSRSRTQRPVR